MFPRCLVESAGLSQELPSGKSLGLTKLEIQRELDLATVLAKILYDRSQTFDNFLNIVSELVKEHNCFCFVCPTLPEECTI